MFTIADLTFSQTKIRVATGLLTTLLTVHCFSPKITQGEMLGRVLIKYFLAHVEARRSSIYAPLVLKVCNYTAVFQVLTTEYQLTLTVLKMYQKLNWKNIT